MCSTTETEREELRSRAEHLSFKRHEEGTTEMQLGVQELFQSAALVSSPIHCLIYYWNKHASGVFHSIALFCT